VKIRKRADGTKFKIRCSKYMYVSLLRSCGGCIAAQRQPDPGIPTPGDSQSDPCITL